MILKIFHGLISKTEKFSFGRATTEKSIPYKKNSRDFCSTKDLLNYWTTRSIRTGECRLVYKRWEEGSHKVERVEGEGESKR